MSGSLDGPGAKINRAKQHFENLAREAHKFLHSNPYEIVTKDDEERSQKVWIVARAEPVPDDIALSAGDVIHNARSALDLLICQLVISNGNAPTRRDSFPISDSAHKFKTGGEAVVKGRISEDALDAIRTIKPYKGGNDGLWILHKLDIADKHRLLFTVGSAHRAVTPPLPKFDWEPPGLTSEETAAFNAEIDSFVGGMFLRPASNQFPLDVGTELLRAPIDFDPKTHINPQFRIEIALSESGIVEGQAILPTLAQLIGIAEQTTETFGALI